MSICSIYVIRNCINGKVYVGQTWESLQERFRKHKLKNTCCVKLLNAFNKYDKANFIIEPLALVSCQEDADKVEQFLIKYFDSIKNGYNIREGGSKGKQSEETKAKISASNRLVQKGLKKSPRTPEHVMNQNKSRMKNSGLTEDIVRNIRSEYATGMISFKRLAIKYDMSKTNIMDIVKYRIWKNIK